VILRDVHSTLTAKHLLFELLKERRPEQSISHKGMPTWEEHVAFVRSRPYEHWYLIEADGYFRGAVYLTRQREVGVAIFEGCRGQHYAEDAVAELMRLHPGRFLANINPANEASIALFRKLSFVGPIQITLEKP
jgi:RimJ/RimL family protein N-acetyltransferase